MEKIKIWKNKLKARLFGGRVAPESGKERFNANVKKQLSKDNMESNEKFSEKKNLIMGVNFANILLAAFTRPDPESAKKTVNLTVFLRFRDPSV